MLDTRDRGQGHLHRTDVRAPPGRADPQLVWSRQVAPFRGCLPREMLENNSGADAVPVVGRQLDFVADQSVDHGPTLGPAALGAIE